MRRGCGIPAALCTGTVGCTISVYGHSSGSEDLGSIQDLWACVPKVLFMLLQSVVWHCNRHLLISWHNFLQRSIFELSLPWGVTKALTPLKLNWGTQEQSALLKAVGEASVRARMSPFPALFPLSKPEKPFSAAAVQECVFCSAKLFLWVMMLCKGEAATPKPQLWPSLLGSAFLQAKIPWWGKDCVIWKCPCHSLCHWVHEGDHCRVFGVPLVGWKRTVLTQL